MVTESATLGVPGIYVSTLRAGVLDMFEEYGLIMQTSSTEEAARWASSLLADPTMPARIRESLDRLLADKIDVTDYVVSTLERAGAD